jgi:hypothetical protein
MNWKHLALSLTALAGAFAPGAAHASENYLPVLQQKYMWPGTTCDVCHLSVVGTAGTAVQPFAMSLRRTEIGLGPLMSDADLIALLDVAEGFGVDSDLDGSSDADELRGLGDPNDAEVGPGEGAFDGYTAPEYGCARIARSSSDAPWATFSAGLIALLLLRSRRRRA